MKHTKSYIIGHPRPQFSRNNFLLLNGSWDFCFDKEDEGIKKQYFLNFPKSSEIEIPYVYQCKSSGIGLEESCKVVWYHKNFDFSKQTKDGNRAILTFEGADYFTKVWVNGEFVGSHKGAYSRFSFDITPNLKEGKADIAIRCEDDYSCIQPRGKQKWSEEVFGCWYTETTGIWKSVWVEFVSPSHLKNVKISTNISDYTAKFDYNLEKLEDNLFLKTVISFDGAVIAEDTCKIVRDRFSRTIDLTSETDPFKKHFWLPHTPNLYDVEFVLYKNDKPIDIVYSYFGLVNYGTENQNITVSDYPVRLKMILDQGYFEGGWLTPTEEQILLDVQLIKKLGFNGVRKHQKIEDERFYYYCDLLGLYVWLEMPSCYEFDDYSMENLTVEWMDILKQHQNHPSIMALVPFNESWGIQRVFSDTKQQRFVRSIYHLSKAILPDKLVVSNDGWEHVESDIITLHNYAENGELLSKVYDRLEDAVKNNYTTATPHKFAFAKGCYYNNQPILLSEFAGIAFEKDSEKGWGYGNMVKNEKEFLERLNSLISAINNIKGFSGYCLTQLTDVQHEINGLFDFSRRLKVDENLLKEIIMK